MHDFDRRMRDLAALEDERPDRARLERVLASLPPHKKERPAWGGRLVPVLIAMLLLGATALAAQMGLSHFLAANPHNFYHQAGGHAAPLNAQPLLTADASGLRSLRAEAVDSAWIEGRLTLTLRLSPTGELPLRMAALTETGEGGTAAELYADEYSAPELRTMPCQALLLLCEDMAVYPRRDGRDVLESYPQIVSFETEEDGVRLALQCPADFILASELEGLTGEDGRVCVRLELYVADGVTGETHAESLILAAASPTDDEKEEMDP